MVIVGPDLRTCDVEITEHGKPTHFATRFRVAIEGGGMRVSKYIDTCKKDGKVIWECIEFVDVYGRDEDDPIPGPQTWEDYFEIARRHLEIYKEASEKMVALKRIAESKEAICTAGLGDIFSKPDADPNPVLPSKPEAAPSPSANGTSPQPTKDGDNDSKPREETPVEAPPKPGDSPNSPSPNGIEESAPLGEDGPDGERGERKLSDRKPTMAMGMKYGAPPLWATDVKYKCRGPKCAGTAPMTSAARAQHALTLTHFPDEPRRLEAAGMCEWEIVGIPDGVEWEESWCFCGLNFPALATLGSHQGRCPAAQSERASMLMASKKSKTT